MDNRYDDWLYYYCSTYIVVVCSHNNVHTERSSIVELFFSVEKTNRRVTLDKWLRTLRLQHVHIVLFVTRNFLTLKFTFRDHATYYSTCMSGAQRKKDHNHLWIIVIMIDGIIIVVCSVIVVTTCTLQARRW